MLLLDKEAGMLKFLEERTLPRPTKESRFSIPTPVDKEIVNHYAKITLGSTKDDNVLDLCTRGLSDKQISKELKEPEAVVTLLRHQSNIPSNIDLEEDKLKEQLLLSKKRRKYDAELDKYNKKVERKNWLLTRSGI